MGLKYKNIILPSRQRKEYTENLECLVKVTRGRGSTVKYIMQLTAFLASQCDLQSLEAEALQINI